jgi:hypothetical protein
MNGARAQLAGMAASYDPNFEFNAPKVPLSPRVFARPWSSCLQRSFTMPISAILATGWGLLSAAPRTMAGCAQDRLRARVPWHTLWQALWREAACRLLHACHASGCPLTTSFLQFHDFTNPCQDDDADLFFDTCNHESLPTGASSVQHVTAQQEDDHVAACEGSEPQQREGSGEPQQGSSEDPVAEHASAEEVVEPAVQATAEKEKAPEQTRAASAPKSGAKGASAGGSKQNSKLTESIISLAGFKGKEAELTLMAGSTVATAAAGDDAPVSARTRGSVEGQRASLGESRSQSSAQKGAASPGGALRTSVSGSAGLKSDEKKRAHKAGASTTPFKSFSKKPRTEESRDAGEKESKTPDFARFGASRGRSAGLSSTPSGRSSSVPGTVRPSMMPRSARKTVCLCPVIFSHDPLCSYDRVLLHDNPFGQLRAAVSVRVLLCVSLADVLASFP